MKKYLALVGLMLIMCGQALASPFGSSLPGDEALQLLKNGNERYASGKSLHGHQDAARRAETVKNGQHPVATIIGCSDSRAPLEMIFDQGLGDLFIIRVAGNVAGPDELASIEYGMGHLGTTVVLVLGHTGCGAVTAAVENAKVHGNIPALIQQIKPAVAKAKTWTPTASGAELLSKSIKANVWLTMENILRKSAEVREAVKDGEVLLVGGIYDLTTGKVEWLGQHPEQGRILATAHIVHKPKPRPKPKAVDETVENQGDSNADAAPEAKPETKAETKAVAKTGSKEKVKTRGKARAKTAAKAEAQDEANPMGHSDGLGELLAPEPSSPPAKGAHK